MPTFVYTKHLRQRIALRGIPEGLPETVYNNADAHYADTLTGMYIALKSISFQGRDRNMALVYTQSGEVISLVTMHPLRDTQVEHRIQSGRWVPYETES